MNQQKLSGAVTLVRALAGHDLWHAEKFCRQAALVDLLLLANTQAATAPARGGSKVDVDRGCVAYSIQSLARRWQWSDVKVTGYLRELAQQGVIKVTSTSTGTVIRFVNYDIYNGIDNGDPGGEAEVNDLAGDLAGHLASDLAANTDAKLATNLAGRLAGNLAQSGSGRNYIGVEGEKENTPLPPKGGRGSYAEEPSDEEVLGYCAQAVTPIPEGFARWRISDYAARAIGWPRNWRRALSSDWLNPVLRAQFDKLMAKNAAEKNGAGLPGKISTTAHVIATRPELEQKQADVDALPDGPAKRAIQAKLDAQWRELERLEAGK